ncbi:hypothetical protein LTR36_010089 [Oleoguttula mirabilis]|uniref:Uncharacterized protein n=1 Tax=Oleoguttula mirabilis TaxID=1507867 RepID=A0AAV9JSJ8_9PEZI|nr:hypothetical protein LTR36_010089 [Oleoguttula mirabilis]
MRPLHSILTLSIICASIIPSLAQVNFSTTNFVGAFAARSGVLESLRPVSSPAFDFSPSDVFSFRDGPGQYHTGDLTFRYRTNGGDGWKDADTAALRANLTNSQADGLLLSGLNVALPDVVAALTVRRTWSHQDGDLTLSFTIQNTGSGTIELGSLGMPIEFNNIFTNRTATETTAKCVLVDPYIGLGAGYVQVTRLTGTGPNLVVTPLNSDSKLEAWRFLSEPEDVPLGYRIQTYEGNYAWQIYSKAYAEQEWNETVPWNPPTSKILAAGETLTVGLRFSVAETVQQIESTVASVGLPVAVGIPGYVLPRDLVGRLFINATQKITAITVEPEGALNVSLSGEYPSSWTGYDVTANDRTFGRARVDISYADGRTQAIHYWIAHPSTAAISELGSFLTNEQWYTNTSDPFGRAPSVITYDREANDYVLQDNRTWIAGLSDEGGAGSFLAAGMKQSVSPNAGEVSKLETFVHEVVWGRLQISSGNETYAVRKSLFFYQPDLVPGYVYDPYFNWTSVPGETWNRSAAYLVDRTYDYVHVSALYWGLYRAGRTHPGMLTRQEPDWYLLQAYHTVIFAYSNASDGTPNTDYNNVGLMGETVWGDLLADLSAENYTAEAAAMQSIMHARQQVWASQPDPYGSEMAWDSTGEEGVYFWSHHFHDNSTAQKTVDAIRGYMPTVAHWGWNGNARRYWDFLYAGSIQLARIERQIHHYGSGLNALPLLSNYRAASDPGSLQAIYNLRVGYGGNQGPLSNIDVGGFGSMAFHSYPDTLRWDAYSGDYGPNFLGHVLGAATYLVEHPDFGWISFGGNVRESNGSVVTVQPKDAVRKRIFVAPVSLYVTIDSGEIADFTYNVKSKEVQVSVASDANSTGGYRHGDAHSQQVVLNWEQTAQQNKTKMQLDARGLRQGLGGYIVEVPSAGVTTISFTACS